MLGTSPRLACFCCSELLCRETERLTEKAACRQDVESVCWSDQASVQSSECKCNFHSFLQQPYHPYSQGSILAQSSSELTASCICAAEKPTITLLSPQCSARLSGVSHGSGTHNRQTDCLWLGLLRVFGQKLEKADQLVSLPAELPVYCSSLNVWKCQIQLTSSLWLHRRVQKGTVAAEEVGKTFLSRGLRSSQLWDTTSHLCFWFPNIATGAMERGSPLSGEAAGVNGGLWHLATLAASVWLSGWSTEGSGMTVAFPTAGAHTWCGAVVQTLEVWYYGFLFIFLQEMFVR